MAGGLVLAASRPAEPAAAATLPTITLGELPVDAQAGGTVTLAYTVDNSTGGAASGLELSQTLPAGLVPIGNHSFCGGTLLSDPPTRLVTLTGASVDAGATCFLNVTVIPETAGSYVLDGSVVSTTLDTAGFTGTLVAAKPDPPVSSVGLDLVVTPATPTAGDVVTLTYHLTGDLDFPLVATFTHLLPAGWAPTAATTTCGGLATAVALTRTVALVGGALMPEEPPSTTPPTPPTCTVNVTATAAAGTYDLSTGLAGTDLTLLAPGPMPTALVVTAATGGGPGPGGPVGGGSGTGGFATMAPVRLRDTRSTGILGGGSIMAVDVAGHAPIAANATLAVLNVTVTEPADAGYVSVFPCGGVQPFVSNLNYGRGQTVANQVTAALGSGGRVCVFSTATTHVVVDAYGFASPTASGGLAGVTPVRLLDTRPGSVLAGGTVRAVTVAGTHGVPSDATAAILNVTATEGSGYGYLLVFPCGQPQPFASSSNFDPGQTVPNQVTASIGTAGQVCIYSPTTVHVLVDLWAFYGPGATDRLTAMTPSRILDTRAGAPVAAGTIREVAVAGVGDIPAGATAVAFNVTVTEPADWGYVSVFPCGGQQPFVSTVNYAPGQTIPNQATIGIGAGGRICVYSTTTTHVLIDAQAYAVP